MRAIRPLILILVMAAGCVVLVTAWSGLASWTTSFHAEIAEGATSQQSCVDDVSVTVDAVWEGFTYTLADPPDYADGDVIWIAYTVTNNSCGEVTVTVTLTGSVSNAAIHDADGSTAPCANGCAIPAGSPEYGTVQWDLGKHPNATGEKVVATVTIDAPSDFSDTDTSNNSATSTDAINIVNEVSTADIGIKSVTASKTAALIGDDIDFTVTIINDGDVEADATVTLDHGDETDELDSAEVSDLAADGERTVTLSWDTDDAAAGEHSLRVLVETQGDSNSANDSKTVTVTLREPSTDVAVTGVKPSSIEAVIGDTVDFTVTLENDGDVAVDPTVSLYKGDDTEALASATAGTIAAGGTDTVTVSWNTASEEAGTYSLRVVVSVADDDDSSNDSATASLTLHDPVDVVLSLTSAVASSAVKGNSVSVPFTVTNSGQNDAGEILVNLHVSEVGQTQTIQEEPSATATVMTLAVGESSSGVLTWDTTDANVGDYDLSLVATTNGDTDQTNNSVSATIEVRNWLAIKNVSPLNAEVVTGETVEFTAQVENVGQEELTDLRVVLSESQIETLIDSATIDSAAAGDTVDASVEWDTAGRDLGRVELFVAAGAEGQVPDGDDTQSVNVTIRNPIALTSATPASADNIAGIPVTINVQVLNESIAEVTDVEVKIDVVEDCENEEDGEEEQNGCATIAAIPAGETGTVALVWGDDVVEPGDHELKIVASVADYGSDANDELSLTVNLRAPVMSVALTEATINRDVAAIGQTLDVVATIANHGEIPVEVPVDLFRVGEMQQTRVATGTSPFIDPGSNEEVTLQWDTTGAVGGTYMLKIAAELPEDTTADDDEKLLKIELLQSAFDGTHDVDSCVEDVRVKVTGIADLGGDTRSPPDYHVGETLSATYKVYNFSCQTDITLVVTMNGPEGHVISDAKSLCFSDCIVPFGGKAEGEVLWAIPTLPDLSDQPIEAKVTVVSPGDFVDVDETNDSNASTDRINIVHGDDVVVRLEEHTDNKASTRKSMNGPEFGAVDVRLVSVNPQQASLPFAAETVEVAVEVANDGPTAEPAAVRFVLAPDDGGSPRELVRLAMVIPAGQTRTETVRVPLRDVLPGVHTVEVLLSAAVDQSSGNNAATFEITRMAPLVNVVMEDVAVSPDVLILGDDATVSLVVRNESEIALPLSLELYVGDDAAPMGTKTIDKLAPDGQSQELIAWRVPASARMLGQHTLRLVASSDDFGAIATVNSEVTFHIDAEVVRINASPPETAMQGEEVAIEVEVKNNGPATVNVPVTLHFPSATKDPETDHAPTPARSTGTASFTWKTTNYAVGEHMLTATVPEQHNIAGGEPSMELPFRVSPLVVTATIVDVSVYPTAPMVGEPVSIAVTVRSDGPVATTIPITLHFPPGGRQPDSRKPRLDPGETGTVVFEWLTGNYRPGTHRFLIEVAAIDTPQQRFTIDLLPTVENVALVGMGAYPQETAMVGEPVEVWVDVRNDGPVALNVPVRLTFPSSSKRPQVQSPRVDPGETERVWFEWKTSNYEPGIHTLRAAILLASNLTLERTTEEIRFALTPLVINATIVDVSVSPEKPRVGEPVTITVSVRNDGRIAATIPVTLHFPSSEKQPETRRPRIDAGAAGTVTFTWRTSRYEPGTHSFVVEVESTSRSEHDFTVELLPPIVDVAIVGMGSDPSETAVQGQEVKVWIDVINNGPSALNVPVQLSFPSAEKQPERGLPSIEPGETARVEFVWKTANYDPGIHALTATLLAEYNVTELDTSATIQIALVPDQLTASIVDISWSPDSPVVGEPVTITVSVRNDGIVAANIPVTLHFKSDDKRPETRRPRLEPGAVGSIAFTWRTSRYEPDAHEFRVEVPSDPPISHHFTVELLPPLVNVAIVGMGSDPSETAVQGQEVKIWVDVINDGPSALNVPVQLTFPSAEKQPERMSSRIEPGEIARIEFTLKTSNYDPGIHALTATLLAEYNITELDTSATIQIRLVSPHLIASIADISWSPESPVVGEPVRITVMVRNDGIVAANIPVTLHFPSRDKQPETRRPRVAPGAVGAASFAWRTSRYEPGMHELRVEVPSVPPVSQQFTVELLPPLVDVAIVGMGSDPSERAVQAQEVKIWVDVINNGPSALNVPVQLSFPSGDKQPERKSAHVEPGEIKRVEFTWKTANYDPGIHALTATLLTEYNVTELDTSATIQIALVPAQLMASIVDISWSPESPVVGEPVRITVTVRNDGIVAANIPVTLHFPSEEKQPETRKPRVEPGAVGSVSFTWRTSRYEPGTHEFRVAVPSDPPISHHFTVELLPPIVDVAIVGMGSDPSETAVQGQEVKIWVDVINDGPSVLNVPVQLSFPSGERQPERKSSRIEPGEIARIEFTWKTANYDVGDHLLTATLHAEYNITELDTSTTIQIALVPARLMASIIDISWSSDSTVVGEPVTITVSVRNDGIVGANIPVTLHFPSGDRQPETRRPRVEPGAVGLVAFTWRTGRYEPGTHEFRVEVPSDPPISHHFMVALFPPRVDVAIVGMGSDPSETAVRGQEVKIWVDVINNGPSALNVPVQLSFPSAEKQPERKSSWIEPGEIARIEFTWKTANYDPGIHALTATLQAEYNVTELDTSATIQIRLVSPQLIASIVDISWSPVSPVLGEPVRITVTVRNDGIVGANIPVTLHFPSGDRQPETRRPRVAPGAVGTASFTWHTSRYEPGTHEFRVEVPSDPPISHHFTIEMLPPIVDVAIVGMGSDPSETAVRGQEVKIWVDVINDGPSALNVPVQLTFQSAEKQQERKSARVEPGEIRRVEFTWKTVNYDPGIHALTAMLLAEYNITELDTSATIQIRLVSPQLVASIVDISWHPASPVVGEPVSIEVTVRNDGIVAARIPVTMHFPSGHRQPETKRPRVAAGAVGAASFTWRTSRYEPGDHVIRVQIPGVAGAVRTFEIELRPPEVDFAVVSFHAPDPLHPIVKGDWVEITAVIQNQGPYAGRGTVYLLNGADLDTMYQQSASLEPGEFRDVEFTWKTLRYPVGGYELLSRVDAEYDTDSDNDESDRVHVHLLTDRDITVGFGNNARPAVFAEPTSEADLSSITRYRNDISVVGSRQAPIDRPVAPASGPPMSVSPKPTSGSYDPARMYWRWRSAQLSPWECAEYQRAIGESLPRAVLCPRAPSVVR